MLCCQSASSHSLHFNGSKVEYCFRGVEFALDSAPIRWKYFKSQDSERLFVMLFMIAVSSISHSVLNNWKGNHFFSNSVVIFNLLAKTIAIQFKIFILKSCVDGTLLACCTWIQCFVSVYSAYLTSGSQSCWRVEYDPFCGVSSLYSLGSVCPCLP
jgi:hypothetical protein